MKLIVGLGNPGRGYMSNRHNVGFHCIDYLAKQHNISVRERGLRLRALLAKYGTGEVAQTPVVLAKPRTYMNLSGRAVSRLVHRFGVPLEDLIVIYDDMDLPLGKIRIRAAGSAGGHKGMASIINSLKSEEFARIRFGIGRPETGDEASHVLSDFTAAERATVKEMLALAADATYCILSQGIESAMNRYN